MLVFSFTVNTCIHHTSALRHYITVHAVVKQKKGEYNYCRSGISSDLLVTHRHAVAVIRRATGCTRAPIRRIPVRHLRARLLDQVLAVRISLRRPVSRIPGFAIRVVVHLVDGLQREVRRFVQEQEDEDGCEEVACWVK